MDALEYLGLRSTHNPHRWYLPVTPGLATMGRFLFGGCGLAAGIAALEGTTGRPVAWATAQYLSFAMVDEIMDLDVTVAVAGRYTAQARVIGRVGEREILTVNAALGHRDFDHNGQWEEMPEVPLPGQCASRERPEGVGESIMSRQEMRIARGRQWDAMDGTPGDGRSALWVRQQDLDMSASALAVLGDFVPFGISQTFGVWARSNSLDNTLRVVKLVPSEWVLLDIRVHAVNDGFGHGLVHLWAQDGTLLATASQSAIVRGLGLPPGLERAVEVASEAGEVGR